MKDYCHTAITRLEQTGQARSVYSKKATTTQVASPQENFK